MITGICFAPQAPSSVVGSVCYDAIKLFTKSLSFYGG